PSPGGAAVRPHPCARAPSGLDCTPSGHHAAGPGRLRAAPHTAPPSASGDGPMRPMAKLLATLLALGTGLAGAPRGAHAQAGPAAVPAANGAGARPFGRLAAGPYDRLVIRNAMVIPGHGGPPAGPYDILIEGNTITQMVPFDPVTAERRGGGARLSGDRVIDATGMTVMPGMIDLHMQDRKSTRLNSSHVK